MAERHVWLYDLCFFCDLPLDFGLVSGVSLASIRQMISTRTLLNDRFALRCGDRHQAESILSAGTFEPKDLIGTAVGRALWSDGGLASAFQFFQVIDFDIDDLKCSGHRPDLPGTTATSPD
jgi:hypothetical protein